MTLVTTTVTMVAVSVASVVASVPMVVASVASVPMVGVLATVTTTIAYPIGLEIGGKMTINNGIFIKYNHPLNRFFLKLLGVSKNLTRHPA
jgi:hypothetical protein